MESGVSTSVRFRPKKRLGQNFLVSSRIADRLVEALKIGPEDVILEIGAGKGMLTRRLAEKAKKVYAVEIDRQLFATLTNGLRGFSNVHAMNADILEVDLSTFGKTKIIGNLPYSLSTPILFHLLHYRNFWNSAILTLQREFAQRLCGQPGTRQYGSITVIFDLFTRRKPIFLIPPHCFSPRPRVSSLAVSVERVKSSITPANENFFFRVVRASFSQRRKVLANSLAKGLAIDKSKLKEVQSLTGISLTRRAETLSLKEFCALSDALYSLSNC